MSLRICVGDDVFVAQDEFGKKGDAAPKLEYPLANNFDVLGAALPSDTIAGPFASSPCHVFSFSFAIGWLFAAVRAT